ATPGFIVLPPGKRLAWSSHTGGTHGQNQGEVFNTTGATANRGEAAHRAQGSEHGETADQAAAALRRQPPSGRRLRRRIAALREVPYLGIAQATNGMVRAHVIRFIPPCRPEEVSKRHYHDVDFQMVYVLKGWISPVN